MPSIDYGLHGSKYGSKYGSIKRVLGEFFVLPRNPQLRLSHQPGQAKNVGFLRAIHYVDQRHQISSNEYSVDR